MGLLNKIYGLAQAGRCLVNIFCDDRSEQPKADTHVSCKFDDRDVEVVIFVHLDYTLAHAQATMERFAGELGGKLKVKSMVETFGVEKASRTPASLEISTLSKRMSRKTRRRRKICWEVHVPGGSRGAHVDGNDNGRTLCARYALWPGSGTLD